MTDPETMNEYLIGVRLRDTVPADDYKLVGDLVLHVGDVVVVETQSGTALGEVRRPRRPVPEFRRDRLYRRVVGLAADEEAREYREQRGREEGAIVTSGQKSIPGRGMGPLAGGKVVLIQLWNPATGDQLLRHQASLPPHVGYTRIAPGGQVRLAFATGVATSRAKMSVPPPGGNGAMSLMGFAGYTPCAATVTASMISTRPSVTPGPRGGFIHGSQEARTRLFSRRPHCSSSRLACQAPPWSA